MGYRVNYWVKGHLVFLSHLEMMRLWHRALLRSDLDVSWTQGFNPRPKVSLGPAKGVGIEGQSEYFDVDFKTLKKSEDVLNSLNSVLPADVRILKVRELPPGTKLLEAVINEAIYRVTFSGGLPADIEAKVAEFLEAEEVLYLRRSPKKDKELNLRNFVYDLEVKDEALYISAKLGPGGAMRPDELLTVLGYWDIMKDTYIQRQGLFIREGNRRSNP